MAENMLSDRPEYGRTFNNAMWTVGFLAAVQILATAWAILSRDPSSQSPSVSAAPGIPSPPVVVPPGPPPVPLDTSREVIPYPTDPNPANPLLPGTATDAPDYPLTGSETSIAPAPGSDSPILPQPTFFGPSGEGQSLSESLARAAVEAPPIEDPILDRLVSAGEEHRASGNMAGALDALREAETVIPQHPRVLGGLAATLSQMGLDSKADIYWGKLYDLGPIRAGSYYKLAEAQVRGENVPMEGDLEKVMSIERIDVEEKAPGSEGQKVSLSIVVRADPANRPVGEDMTLLVFFYDRVNGDSIDASTADTSYLYPTEDYDWATNGTETVIVNYHQPIFTEEQQRELGERTYYGYAVELYYRDVLQEKITVPEDIAALRETLDTGPDASAPSGPGPENALFPDPLNP